MDAILFIHHLPLHEPVTRKHLALMRAMNPSAEVVPLRFEPVNTPQWQWQNCDLVVLEWFAKTNPRHDRYFILEWDTFCSQSVREFYGNAYDLPAVSAAVVQPWSRALIPSAYGNMTQMRDWHWFTHNESPDLYPYLRGMCPMCGSMFQHDVLFNMVQLWKSSRAFDALFCECRLGTLACMAGYEPKPIKPDCWRWLHSGEVDFDQGAGIYHKVTS